MIVRRLCVTPAVGSLMQWLLTRRKRTRAQLSRRTEMRGNVKTEVRPAELEQNTKQLLDGPLKHVRAAALAAALVPLASLVAKPASARTVCGLVFNDTNHNGVQDTGEAGIEGVAVTISDGTNTFTTETGPDGSYA